MCTDLFPLAWPHQIWQASIFTNFKYFCKKKSFHPPPSPPHLPCHPHPPCIPHCPCHPPHSHPPPPCHPCHPHHPTPIKILEPHF